jgi:hypothetical protein
VVGTTKVTVECKASHVLVLCSQGQWNVRLFWHVKVAGVCFCCYVSPDNFCRYVKNDMHGEVVQHHRLLLFLVSRAVLTCIGSH